MRVSVFFRGLGGGFKYCVFSPPIPVEMIRRVYVSNGFKWVDVTTNEFELDCSILCRQIGKKGGLLLRRQQKNHTSQISFSWLWPLEYVLFVEVWGLAVTVTRTMVF